MYLNGSIPRLYNAVKISNFYECSLDYLFSINNNYSKQAKPIVIDRTNFYKKYQKLLNENKITHYALSKKIGICESSLSTWKKLNLPGMLAIIKIADYFVVSNDYLVGRSDNI